MATSKLKTKEKVAKVQQQTHNAKKNANSFRYLMEQTYKNFVPKKGVLYVLGCYASFLDAQFTLYICKTQL